MFIKLAPGMKATDYVAAVNHGEDFPSGAEDCSGPGLTAPGEHVDAWLRLAPGRYVMWCGMPMVTSGGNPGGITHDLAGMVREFEVKE